MVKRRIWAGALALTTATVAVAQPPATLTERIRAIGRVVDPPSSIALYGPMHRAATPNEVVRDVAYGPDAREILDVFPSRAKQPLPVLIFLPGGPGDKRSPFSGGEPFYDNVMLWARANGMVGVNAQRRAGPEPDAAARDVDRTIRWVAANIGRYGGDPRRIFIWGHSAGATALAIYLARPDLQSGGGAGVKGAVLGAGTYNLAPFAPKSPPAQTRMGLLAEPHDAPIPADPAQSIAKGIQASSTPILVAAAEQDPPVLVEMADELERELRVAGRRPGHALFRGHGHLTAIFAVNTGDRSTSAPILRWMQSIK